MSQFKNQNFAALFTKHQATLPPPIKAFLLDLLTQYQDQHLNLAAMLDHGLVAVDNFDWKKIAYETNATPDTEDTIPHTLKRIPEGFIVINADKAARLYAGGTAWTKENIYLSCDVASAAVTIYVF